MPQHRSEVLSASARAYRSDDASFHQAQQAQQSFHPHHSHMQQQGITSVAAMQAYGPVEGGVEAGRQAGMDAWGIASPGNDVLQGAFLDSHTGNALASSYVMFV